MPPPEPPPGGGMDLTNIFNFPVTEEDFEELMAEIDEEEAQRQHPGADLRLFDRPAPERPASVEPKVAWWH